MHKYVLFTRTVTFGEHKCFGEGANYTKRVAYGKQLTDAEAAKFTDISFIDGQQWLNQSDIFLQAELWRYLISSYLLI